MSARRSTPGYLRQDDFIDDAFKTSPEILARTINSPGILDKINNNSFELLSKKQVSSFWLKINLVAREL
jgi:hypothetical protein